MSKGMQRAQQEAIDRHRRLHNAQVAKDEAEWSKVADKHYRHAGGVEVIYRHNAWMWEVVGGKNDGYRFKLLWVAQEAAAVREP